ncbi:MAG: hypothetical protein ABWX61_09930, partial [Paenisporosarcina sp.]
NNSFAIIMAYINPTWPEWLLLNSKADLYTHIPLKFGVLIISATMIWFVIHRLRDRLRLSSVEEISL